MTPRPFAAMLALAAAAAALPAQQLPETHSLRVPPKKGATIWYVEMLRQTQTMREQDWVAKMELHRAFTLTVREVADDGDCIVEVHVRRLHGTATLPMIGERTFDSLDEQGVAKDMAGLGEALHDMMSAVGKRFLARVGADGAVQGSLEGVAEELDANDAPLWDAASLRQLVEAAFGRRPAEAKAVGDSWRDTQRTAESGMPIEQQVEVTLAEASASALRTTIAGKLVALPPAERTAAPNAAVFRELEVEDGEVRGERTISRRDGLVTATRLRATAALTYGAPAQQTKVSMSIDTILRRSTSDEAMRRAPKRDGEQK